MDNRNYQTNRPRKRVTRKMARRRQLIALGVILVVIILGIILICSACSKKNSGGGDTTPDKSLTTTAATTAPAEITTTMPITTTAPVVTADPNNPNTITGLTLDKYSVDVKVGAKDMPWVTMTPASSTEKQEKWESSDESIATVDRLGNITGVAPGTCYVTVYSVNNPMIYAEVKVTVTSADGTPNGAAGQTPENTGIQPTSNNASETPVTTTTATNNTPVENPNNSNASEPTYVQGVLIANKSYSLPADYAPGLDSTTESQFNALSVAAAQEGLNIYLSSGYRSYDYQKKIYNNYSSLYGADTADTFSARPGHSEHQTGLAIDVNSIDDSFAGTPEAVWLENHAHEYGFIIRYPKGKESITGYKYEPWHIRYLGKDTATAVYNSGLTLEEYLGVDSKYQ